jgi:predicted amidophosphoribosyltransferase
MPLSLCPACRLPACSVITNLPCEECISSLLISPEICPRCLGFACPTETCDRPWLAIDGEAGRFRFDSVTAAYLSVGPGARVLKSWKTSPSPSLTRFLIAQIRAALTAYSSDRPLFLIPVPQSGPRRWELDGGSTLRLCTMIREARKNHNDRVLDLLEVGARTSAQAMSRGNERYSRRAPISPRGDSPEELDLESEDFQANPSLVLVDDFLTSGSTLRAAAKATREKLEALGGFGGRNARLDVFVLGFRPALFGIHIDRDVG